MCLPWLLQKEYQIATRMNEIETTASSNIQAAVRKCRQVKTSECLPLAHHVTGKISQDFRS